MPERWPDERLNRFAADMEAAGYEVEDYRDRFYHHGPAVRIDDGAELQNVIRATEVRLH